MAAQNDFYTMQSLATFAGTTGATAFVTNGLQRAFNWNPAWLGLAVAEVVCLATAQATQSPPDGGTLLPASSYFVAVLNGFLVYATAAGTTAVGNVAVKGGDAAGTPAPAALNRGGTDRGADARRASVPARRRGFLDPWF